MLIKPTISYKFKEITVYTNQLQMFCGLIGKQGWTVHFNQWWWQQIPFPDGSWKVLSLSYT